MDENKFTEIDHWYGLSDYLERDEDGFVSYPWVLKSDHPDWCEEVLKQWKEQKAKGFKVP